MQMNARQFKKYLTSLEELTPTQQLKLSDKIKTKIESEKSLQVIESRINNTPKCPHCQSEDLVRWGKSDSLQRYKCKQCQKTFNSLTGTPLSRLRYKGKWLEYSHCLVEGYSVRKSAKICGVDMTTSFRWRHRFLSSPAKTQPAEMLGITEADEFFFTHSEKGNRNLTHRKPRKRGKSNKKNVGERVPVLLIRDRNRSVAHFVYEQISKEAIHKSMSQLINKDVVLCTDGNSIYKSFAKKNHIPHKRILSNDPIRVIDNIFHIQNINAYISRLRGWMHRFNGVSSKYLVNYLSWRRIIENFGKEVNAETYFKEIMAS